MGSLETFLICYNVLWHVCIYESIHWQHQNDGVKVGSFLENHWRVHATLRWYIFLWPDGTSGRWVTLCALAWLLPLQLWNVVVVSWQVRTVLWRLPRSTTPSCTLTTLLVHGTSLCLLAIVSSCSSSILTWTWVTVIVAMTRSLSVTPHIRPITDVTAAPSCHPLGHLWVVLRKLTLSATTLNSIKASLPHGLPLHHLVGTFMCAVAVHGNAQC